MSVHGHLGNYNTATSRTHVRFTFSTHDAAGANVAPSSAFEAADLRIYKATDGAALSATQRSSAAGITMTSPFDSLTGVHNVTIDLTDNTDSGFFSSGCYYEVWLCPDETVDSQTITGVCLCSFEIGVPAVNTIQVSGTTQTARDIGASVLLSSGTGTGQVKLSSGYIAPNWGDVGNPTTSVNLSGTTINLANTVTTLTGHTPQTGDTYAALPANFAAMVISVGGITDVNVVGLDNDVITAAKLASDVTTELQSGLATAAALSTVAGYLDTEIAAILADTNELQTDWANGGRLDLILDARASQASVDTIDDLLDTEIGALTTAVADLPTNSGLTTALGTLNDLSAAQVNAEVDSAIETYHLDHLFATTYDPASKPGAADALLNELIESDSGVSRFTANALEQGPSGGGGVADWTSDERTAIRAILGIPASGTTPDDPTAGILDTIRDAVGVVDGIVDDILLDTAEIGAAGAGLTNINLPNQTMDIVGNITGNLSGSVGSVTAAITLPTIPTNWITATGINADAITAAKIAADVTTEIQSGLATASALSTLQSAVDALPTAAAIADGVWDEATSGHTTSGTFGEQLKTDVDTLVSRLTSSRAGYLDNLSAGAVAQQTSLQSLINDNTSNFGTTINSLASVLFYIGTPADTDLATDIANVATQIAALPTAAENATELFDQANGIESGVTFRQAQRAMAAVLSGLLADAGEDTETYKGIGQASGGTTRVTLTSNAAGDRTALILNL